MVARNETKASAKQLHDLISFYDNEAATARVDYKITLIELARAAHAGKRKRDDSTNEPKKPHSDFERPVTVNNIKTNKSRTWMVPIAETSGTEYLFECCKRHWNFQGLGDFRLIMSGKPIQMNRSLSSIIATKEYTVHLVPVSKNDGNSCSSGKQNEHSD